MADFTITISTPDIHLGGFFSEFWRIISAKKGSAEAEIKRLILDFARDGHRSLGGTHYKNQTGQLRASTKVKGSFNLGEQIELYIDESQVDYAGYVINKRASWNGDPFINESIQYNMPRINEIIQKLYNDAINEFNSLP